MPTKWPSDEALPVIRTIDRMANRCNFYVALRGGVLLRGESDTDLDLFVLSKEGPEF